MSKSQNPVAKKEFNFLELIQEGVDRRRTINSSIELQNKVLLLKESWQNDEEFFSSDEGHVYQDQDFMMDPQNMGNDLYGQAEINPEQDVQDKMSEIVKSIESYCGDNYDRNQNPELHKGLNELMSAFYKFKASGRADGFGSSILEIYRNLKQNKSNSLANQFSTDTIFDSLEELNQLVGKVGQNQLVSSPFSGF